MKVLSAVAWPYANGPRHLGHVAGFGVPSDVFSRYMRMAGHDVLMVSGSDEHGTPILVLADQAGVSPREFVDRNHAVIAGELADLGCTYDLYTRTTTANHYAVAQELFHQNWLNGYMVERTQQGAISPSTGRTLPDRFIEGECPICHYPDARGDQCDNCGNQLEPEELLNPRSKINGETPRFVETQHFFLDLPALADALREWLAGREASGTWRPNVIRFSRNILDEIKPRAMTRDIDWGIPVPLDGWRDNPAKRLYVWFDAVVGYLSASVEWARRLGEPDRWREWWNDPEALSYYFMGKDNITFHSQIWPAELLGYAGKGERGGEPGVFGPLNLPTEVVSSEFLTMEGRQFSTSRGYTVLVRDVLDRYGPDGIRYFICAAGPENQDANFTWKEFVQRNNSELVAGWGNLVSRTAAMVARNFGEIPQPGPLEPVDEEVRASVLAAFDTVGELISRHRQKAAIAEAMRVVGEVNAYVSRTEPFKLKGEDERERLATVLHTLVQCVADLNLVLSPFLPHAANRVHLVLGGEGELVPMPRLETVTGLDPEDEGRSWPVITGEYSATPRWESRPVVVGTPIAKPAPVFTKLDESVVDDELARAGA
ncbi:methionine--tRNA ligase [Phycicoccus endophyticus]|uniref:Methionine--tRNA ligase n=1 Tax=Phycicoccus endophyticus TaxID=1690220 RepID=A0A7G9R2D1_9MICO|nr:methionine--tRNA ligase [Phycicoccus endophyticus]NHI20864.1 methionine--tRNA ligase [Phycicoccus endophyticus]QNN49756.1 methionine--tRNA ligase [Phycicoccus endophyticus]GGL34835.1 methionine--tRNA ligase [Phycicoccus endophyticus]